MKNKGISIEQKEKLVEISGNITSKLTELGKKLNKQKEEERFEALKKVKNRKYFTIEIEFEDGYMITKIQGGNVALHEIIRICNERL